MQRNFEFVDGIYLSLPPHKYDLHNDYDFSGLNYSIESRVLVLQWKRGEGGWVSTNLPKKLNIHFYEVSEFRFLPRNADIPFTEDDCIISLGFWADENPFKEIAVVDSGKDVNPNWLMAIQFMSGAVIAVQSDSARAEAI